MKCPRSVVESVKKKVASIRPVYHPSNLLSSTNVSLIRHEQESCPRAWESAPPAALSKWVTCIAYRLELQTS